VRGVSSQLHHNCTGKGDSKKSTHQVLNDFNSQILDSNQGPPSNRLSSYIADFLPQDHAIQPSLVVCIISELGDG
ncbi:MAG: hypothetical protein Q7J07_00805, partial [Pelolinea sp.]|nr:hypothetical protein [Pelolinea sp.]